MAESKGPPRKTTTYNRFSTMASQNQRYNTKQDEFFWLENIMRVAPHKLHSVPGPGAQHFFPIPGPTCIDTTLRGQQVITIETAFDQSTTFGGGNLRTTWGYINNGEFYSLIGQAQCAGGNMAYTPSCVQINHYINDDPTLFEAITIPISDPLAPFINARIGTADQPVWASNSNAYAGGGVRIYTNLGNSFADYAIPVHGGTANCDNFAISGSDVWLYSNNGGQTYFPVYTLGNGTPVTEYQPFGTDNVIISNMQFTTNFLYCVGSFSGVRRLYKINRTNGVIVDSLDVSALGVQFVCVANDNLQYLLCAGNPASVYYVDNFTDPFYVGYTGNTGFTPFGLGTGVWNNGTIYFGSTGFGGFDTDVFKIVVPCPPVSGPIIPTLSTTATVAAGGSITATWGNILVPGTFDKILIKPQPAADVIGLAGTTIADSGNLPGTSSGSISITIPGGTTPGNYVAMYAVLGLIWAATSAPFTVT